MTPWVVQNLRTKDYVGPNRRMVPSLLSAGVWDESRARRIAGVERLRRAALPLRQALEMSPAFLAGSVSDMLAGWLEEPEVSEERPDGYVFRHSTEWQCVLVSDESGKAIGDVSTYGFSESMDRHPLALAHARWILLSR